jgi:hypothetical protein
MFDNGGSAGQAPRNLCLSATNQQLDGAWAHPAMLRARQPGAWGCRSRVSCARTAVIRTLARAHQHGGQVVRTDKIDSCGHRHLAQEVLGRLHGVLGEGHRRTLHRSCGWRMSLPVKLLRSLYEQLKNPP